MQIFKKLLSILILVSVLISVIEARRIKSKNRFKIKVKNRNKNRNRNRYINPNLLPITESLSRTNPASNQERLSKITQTYEIKNEQPLNKNKRYEHEYEYEYGKLSNKISNQNLYHPDMDENLSTTRTFFDSK